MYSLSFRLIELFIRSDVELIPATAAGIPDVLQLTVPLVVVIPLVLRVVGVFTPALDTTAVADEEDDDADGDEVVVKFLVLRRGGLFTGDKHR